MVSKSQVNDYNLSSDLHERHVEIFCPTDAGTAGCLDGRITGWLNDLKDRYANGKLTGRWNVSKGSRLDEARCAVQQKYGASRGSIRTARGQHCGRTIRTATWIRDTAPLSADESNLQASRARRRS